LAPQFAGCSTVTDFNVIQAPGIKNSDSIAYLFRQGSSLAIPAAAQQKIAEPKPRFDKGGHKWWVAGCDSDGTGGVELIDYVMKHVIEAIKC
jgi:hypothetical protein